MMLFTNQAYTYILYNLLLAVKQYIILPFKYNKELK